LIASDWGSPFRVAEQPAQGSDEKKKGGKKGPGYQGKQTFDSGQRNGRIIVNAVWVSHALQENPKIGGTAKKPDNYGQQRGRKKGRHMAQRGRPPQIYANYEQIK
jgi:hypothetical protein